MAPLINRGFIQLMMDKYLRTDLEVSPRAQAGHSSSPATSTPTRQAMQNRWVNNAVSTRFMTSDAPATYVTVCMDEGNDWLATKIS